MAAPKTVLTYPLNGSLKDFDVPFEYLARKFVVVTLVGATRRVLVLNSEYRFTTKKQITTTTAWGPAQGFESIEIRRVTSATERLVDFNDGSILRAYDLNTAQVQSLHIAEEARDLTADTIAVNNDGDLDARGKKIVNLADAVLPGDAVTLRQEQSWAASTLGNKNASESAANLSVSARDASIAAKDQSVSFANASENSSLAAKDWASKPEGSVVSGGLYSSYHYSRKASASAISAGLSEDEATHQAELATSNGAAQVALAAAQVTLSTTQAGIATTKAAEAAASAAVVGGFVGVNKSFRNLLINGHFRIWQRGASWTYTNAFNYNADRWGVLVNEGTVTVTQQGHAIGQSEVPDNPAFYQRIAMTGMSSGANQGVFMLQRIEDVQTAQGKMVTLTYWARASVAGAKLGTEINQSFGPNAANPTPSNGAVQTLTTSWAKYTRQFTVPSIVGKTLTGQHCLGLSFWLSAGSSAAVRMGGVPWVGTGHIDIAQVQLEIGEATPFENLPVQVVVELCRRYYEVVNGTVAVARGPYDWREFATTKYRVPNLTVLIGGGGGSSVDAINADRFRWGIQASVDQDWTIGADAEIQ